MTATPAGVGTAHDRARLGIEQLRRPRQAIDLAQQHLAPAPHRLQRHRARDSGLPNPALADDDEQPASEEIVEGHAKDNGVNSDR
jgi:hypothetical protein